MSGAHWAREVEWLRFPATLALGFRLRSSQLRSVVVLWFTGVWKELLGCVEMFSCVCSAGESIGLGEEAAGLRCLADVSVVSWIAVAVRVGAAASRAGLLRRVRNL